MARAHLGAHQTSLEKVRDTTPGMSWSTRFACVMPHQEQVAGPRRGSAINGRTTSHRGYAQLINARKRIEQVFGAISQAAGLR